MSRYQKYILLLLYYLSRITGILEFRFDSKKQKFTKSRTGYYYVCILNLLSAMCLGLCWLFASISAYIVYIKNNTIPMTFNIAHIAFQIYVFYFSRTVKNTLYNRYRLLQLLNLFLRLRKKHHQLFGKPLIIIHRLNFLTHFLRSYIFCGITILASKQVWILFVVLFYVVGTLVQMFLADSAIMIHFQLLKPLTVKLSLFSATNAEQGKLYIKYAVQLIKLRKMLQEFLWHIFFLRIAIEIGFLFVIILKSYWTTNTPLAAVFYLLGNYCHGIWILSIASRVYKMEIQVVDHLYDRELFDILLNLKTKRNLNLLKVSSK